MVRRIACLLIGACAAGCGGGGGGDHGQAAATTPMAGATITRDNALEIAGVTSAAAFMTAELDQLADFGLLGTPQTLHISLPTAGSDAGLAKHASQLQAAAPADAGGTVPAAATQPCPRGGAMTIHADIEHPGAIVAGDTVRLDYAQCELGDHVIADGGIDFTIARFGGDLLGDRFELEFALQLNDMQLSDTLDNLTIDGDVHMTLVSNITTTTATVSGSTLAITDGANAWVLSDFATTITGDLSIFPEAWSLASSGYLMSSAFDGELRFETSRELRGSGPDRPYDGELSISGADGTSLTVIPLDGARVRIEMDLDGDGAVDADGTHDITWAQLLAE